MTAARLRGALAALVLMGLLYWLAQGPSSRSQPLEEPTPAPALSLPDLAGKTQTLAGLRGQVVLVDFWATWCEPCLETIPELARLYRELGGKDFTILGVAMDARGREVVAPFAAAHDMPYPILIGEAGALRAWRIPGYPATFLIDAQGRVRKRYLGAVGYAELAHDVKTVLGR